MSTPLDNIFCPLPFAHTDITTDGTYAICCDHVTPKEHAMNIKQFSFESWQNSKYLNEVKDSFRQNKPHAGCKRCWTLESLGQVSRRQLISKDYSFFKVTTENDKLISLQVNLGNLCNLSCLMCDEKYSSAILSENKKLGISVREQKDFSWTDQAYDHLQKMFDQKPKILIIIGGEPLYIKKFLEILEGMPEEFFRETMLQITTNVTVWNDRWSAVIQRFKLARITFSIDAIGDLFEYIRFPANWNQVADNIKQITQLKNVKTTVNCTVQNLNIASLYDLIIWCQKQNLWLTLQQLTRPNYLILTNLPNHLKKQAIDNLNQCLTIEKIPMHVEKFIRSCLDQLTDSLHKEFDQELWTQCINYLEIRDGLRNNSHRKFLIY